MEEEQTVSICVRLEEIYDQFLFEIDWVVQVFRLQRRCSIKILNSTLYAIYVTWCISDRIFQILFEVVEYQIKCSYISSLHKSLFH